MAADRVEKLESIGFKWLTRAAPRKRQEPRDEVAESDDDEDDDDDSNSSDDEKPAAVPSPRQNLEPPPPHYPDQQLLYNQQHARLPTMHQPIDLYGTPTRRRWV